MLRIQRGAQPPHATQEGMRHGMRNALILNALQKGIFQAAKYGLSACKRCPIRARYATFWKTPGMQP